MFKGLFKNKKTVDQLPGMLKMLGIDINSLLPQAEKGIKEWLEKMQEKAGAKLILLASVNDDTGAIEIQLHKLQDNVTTHWQTFNLSDITDFIKNLENQDNTLENEHTNFINDQPAAIDTTATADSTGAEPTDTNADDSAAE